MFTSAKKLTSVLSAAALLAASWPAPAWAAQRATPVQTEGAARLPAAPVLDLGPAALAPLTPLSLSGEAGLLVSNPALLAAAAAAGSLTPAVEARVALPEAALRPSAPLPPPRVEEEGREPAPGVRGALETLSERTAEAEEQDPGGAETGAALSWFDQGGFHPAGAAAQAVAGVANGRVRPSRLASSTSRPDPKAAREEEADRGRTVFLQVGGTGLSARLLLPYEQETAGIMGHAAFPEKYDAYLHSMEEEGPIAMWYRDSPASDLVWLGKDGAVRAILHRVPAVGRRTPWPDVPIYESDGMHLMALRPGRAKELGLTIGARVEGLERPAEIAAAAATVVEAGVHDLLAMVLDQEPAAAGAKIVEYLRLNPEGYGEFDQALRRLDRESAEARRAGKREWAAQLRALRDGVARAVLAAEGLEHRGQLEASISLVVPWQWFKRLDWVDKAFFLPELLITYPQIFFHEGGHAVASRLVGHQVTAFRVGLNGSGYMGSRGPEGPPGWRDAFVSAMGPMGQVALAALAWAGAGLLAWALHSGAPHHDISARLVLEVLAAVYLAMLGLMSALTAIPSGGTDWYHAAGHMGWHKLSEEMRWRHQRLRQGAYGYLSGVLGQGLSWALRWPLRRLRGWRPAEPGEFEGEGRLY